MVYLSRSITDQAGNVSTDHVCLLQVTVIGQLVISATLEKRKNDHLYTLFKMAFDINVTRNWLG